MSKMTIDVESGQLRINGSVIQLPIYVKNALLIDKLIVVCGKRKEDNLNNGTVYALDARGEIIWEILKAPIYGGHAANPYVNVELTKDGQLIALTAVGANFKVDLATGAIALYEFNR